MTMSQAREDYLHTVSEDYGVPLFIVHSMAELLGPQEDNDGLLAVLEDYEERH